MFGISKPNKGFVTTGELTAADGFSYLTTLGPNRRIYWFLFQSIGKAKHGKNIPRYTKEDEARLVKDHETDIVGGITFKELYETRSFSTLTPIEEHIWKNWHFERVITFGDAAHKVSNL